jgi:hypothetical protein
VKVVICFSASSQVEMMVGINVGDDGVCLPLLSVL